MLNFRGFKEPVTFFERLNCYAEGKVAFPFILGASCCKKHSSSKLVFKMN